MMARDVAERQLTSACISQAASPLSAASASQCVQMVGSEPSWRWSLNRHPDMASVALAGTAVLALLLGGLWMGAARAAQPAPFVGCPAEGMSGPVPAPATLPVDARVPAAGAGQLALYAAEGQHILAPRGWHCIEIYGSGGAFLLVTPHPYTAAILPNTNKLAGPAVELSLLSGENSGRDQVAEVFSRLFPFKRDFIRDAASNYDVPPRYPHGPFPGDRTIRRSRAEVDYITPPHGAGMGTYDNRLQADADPIVGTAILAQVQGVDSVVLLNIRLPPQLRALGPIILRAAAAAQLGGHQLPR